MAANAVREALVNLPSQPFDLAIIGAGINGAGIARDASGRGLSVVILDAGDIGGATSSVTVTYRELAGHAGPLSAIAI